MFVNSKSIAILIATYNVEKYVIQQINSIISQSETDWSLYIRDDGSNDATIRIIEDYAQRFDNVFVIKDNKGNLGCRDNFFELLSMVESKYYAFSDADDVWLPNKVQVTYECMRKLESENSNTPIAIHTDMSVTDSELNITANSMWRAAHFNPNKIKSYNYLGIHCFVGGATMMLNQMAKDVSQPFNRDIHMHDLWVGLCVVQKGILYSIDIPTMLYRQHGANSVGGASSEQLTLKYKILNFKKVLNINIRTVKMLKKIGWGSFLKYLYYKTKLVLMMRSGKMFNN